MSQVFIVNKANHQTLHAADRKKYALFFIGIEEGLESTRNIIFGSATSPLPKPPWAISSSFHVLAICSDRNGVKHGQAVSSKPEWDERM